MATTSMLTVVSREQAPSSSASTIQTVALCPNHLTTSEGVVSVAADVQVVKLSQLQPWVILQVLGLGAPLLANAQVERACRIRRQTLLEQGLNYNQHSTVQPSGQFYFGNNAIAKREPEGGAFDLLPIGFKGVRHRILTMKRLYAGGHIVLFGYELYARLHHKEWLKRHGHQIYDTFLLQGTEDD
ncbi:hypothetical protein BDQ17DRAFT_1419118 [Cyathus striatus]|nr:hypothetical protein BDQ17DRAFT_1419118 [Cyathus striatus]